jgi:heme/copper-type cytochrome/quinol oxidase subunit 3
LAEGREGGAAVKERVVGTLENVQSGGFGAQTLAWWGTLGFIVIEATGFALAIAAYLYLQSHAAEWPLSAPPPDLLPGTLVTVILLASLLPNYLAQRWARKHEVAKVRLALVVMSAFGLLPLLVRPFEFPALNISWDSNAYGSVVWTLLGLHTAHLLTDFVDTVVVTVLVFTRHGHNPRRLADVADNAFYWYFVVFSWLPVYFVIYWLPRL